MTDTQPSVDPSVGTTRRRALGAAGALVAAAFVSACSSGSSTSSRSSPSSSPSGEVVQQAGTAAPAVVGAAFDLDLLVDVPAGGAVPEGFSLGRFLVTNAQYASFLDATGHAAPSAWPGGAFFTGKDDHPVLFVSATEAEAYCGWLGGQHPGRTFGLPTQEQWQAVAGAAGGDWPWGAAAPASYRDGVLTSRMTYNGVLVAAALAEHGDDLVTYTDRSSRAGTTVRLADLVSLTADGGVRGWIDHGTRTGLVFTDLYADVVAAGGWTTPVGSAPDGATASGIADLAGNAWEWTSSTSVATNGAEQGSSVRAVRGGSWYATSRSCTTSYTGEGRAPSGGFNSVGFRVASVVA